MDLTDGEESVDTDSDSDIGQIMRRGRCTSRFVSWNYTVNLPIFMEQCDISDIEWSRIFAIEKRSGIHCTWNFEENERNGEK